jgi:hypothetical protein
MELRPTPPSLQLASLPHSSVGTTSGAISALSTSNTSQLDSYLVRLTGKV